MKLVAFVTFGTLIIIGPYLVGMINSFGVVVVAFGLVVITMGLGFVGRYRRQGQARSRHAAAGLAIIALMMLLGAVVGGLLPGLSRGKQEMRWAQLVAPTEPAIEILGRTLYPATAFLRTESGVYACGEEWDRAQPCSKVTKMPDPSELCKPIGSSALPAPGEVANSLKVSCWGGEYTVSYDLVLLKDGHAFESSELVSWGDGLVVLLASCLGGGVGLIVGVVIVVVRSKHMKKQQVTVEEISSTML